MLSGLGHRGEQQPHYLALHCLLTWMNFGAKSCCSVSTRDEDGAYLMDRCPMILFGAVQAKENARSLWCARSSPDYWWLCEEISVYEDEGTREVKEKNQLRRKRREDGTASKYVKYMLGQTERKQFVNASTIMSSSYDTSAGAAAQTYTLNPALSTLTSAPTH